MILPEKISSKYFINKTAKTLPKSEFLRRHGPRHPERVALTCLSKQVPLKGSHQQLPLEGYFLIAQINTASKFVE